MIRLLACLFVPLALGQSEKPEQKDLPPAEGRVISVYDGDTLTLASGDKVRFRWINTPEMRPLEEWAAEARDEVSRYVEGEKVQLRYGESYKDSYGRLVAEVFYAGMSLDEHLLQLGLAHLMLFPPLDEDMDRLYQAQATAKAQHVGIWTSEHYQGVLHITSFHANAPGDDRKNVNGEYLRVCNISDTSLDVGGYTITTARHKTFTFPSLVIPPGFTVEVHSGPGEHQTDPHEQLVIFLGSDTPIWMNGGDKATIRDPEGNTVDVRVYEVHSY